ncbi:MAG: tRNA (adenosine(37)-N6)-dimethylallyltransferase MiaA [Deltaproteobacteria bacterium]|nr:tRNA (adenosine(37)-N6)-dimethylallyltransferase MiaA [Deltaproteobacteria bacterium]
MTDPHLADRPPVVVVTGPTASGKTAAALRLAMRLHGEIVSADSMQVYRYLDIGTAKPSLAERARVPHHLIDVVTPDVEYNAGRYAREARAAVAGIHARGRVVLVTGGTGLYIRALVEGLLDQGGADRDLRERLEREHAQAVAAGDPEHLHRRLGGVDPDAAARIHPNDLRRIVRALELASRSGVRASALRGEHAFADRPYSVLHLVLDPGIMALDERTDARCAEMIERGLLREVRGVLDRGYSPKLRPLQAIGYRHVIPVALGADTLANALEAMQRDTRRFARRQRTWVRGVHGAIVLHPDDEDGLVRRVEDFLHGRAA